MDALKAAISAIDEATADQPETAVTRATAVGLMHGYHKRWSGAEWSVGDISDVEREFCLPIVNPDTGRTSRTFKHAGKYDGVVEYKGRPFLLEHKCVTGDSTVYDYQSGQLLTVAAMCERGIAPTVLSVEMGTGRLVKARAGVPREESVRPVYEVVMRSGRKIRVSDNHPVMTAGGWVMAAKLNVGSRVAVPSRTGHADAPETFTDHEVAFVGYMLGDGYMPGLRFSKSAGPVLDGFLRSLAGMGVHDGRGTDRYHVIESDDRVPSVQVSCQPECVAMKLINRLGIRDCLAADKFIPDELLSLNDRQTGILLGALWSTDGCVDCHRESRGGVIVAVKPRIALGSRSARLCEGVQRLLLRLGVNSSVTMSSVKYKGERRNYTTVKVTGRSSKRRFFQLIASGTIPFLKSSNAVADAVANIKGGEDGRDCPDHVWGDGARVFWDRVKSVTVRPAEMMYDLTVPATGNFVVNDIVTHNTTSEDIQDPNAPYFRRLEIDAQVSGYMLANWQEGHKLDGTLYDVVRKPGIRPKQVSRGGRIETPDEFCDRLIQDTLDRPDFYYARKTIFRQDLQLLEFARELWDVADEIREARTQERHYRNSGSCMLYNRPCEYLGICSGHDTTDSDRWVTRRAVHAELPLVEGDGRDVLTNSRVSCFKACRRKHYYRYELAIERADRRQDEALYFGTVMHAAWAAWWACLSPTKEDSHVRRTRPAVSEAAGLVGSEADVAR